MPNPGPVPTFFGIITNIDGCVFCCDESCVTTPTPTPAFDAQGRRVFSVKTGQFVIVVEGKKGASGANPGTSLEPFGADNRPDIWIESTRNLGNGSTTVCDTSSPSQGGGGVPGINPPNFNAEPTPSPHPITDALTDFACRFDPGVGVNSPCTLTDQTREAKTITANAAVQFCDFVAATALFPSGETVLTVQLRDVLGNLGPTAQIVVRVATPTPTKTP